jgi:gluconolactonase
MTWSRAAAPRIAISRPTLVLTACGWLGNLAGCSSDSADNSVRDAGTDEREPSVTPSSTGASGDAGNNEHADAADARPISSGADRADASIDDSLDGSLDANSVIEDVDASGAPFERDGSTQQPLDANVNHVRDAGSRGPRDADVPEGDARSSSGMASDAAADSVDAGVDSDGDATSAIPDTGPVTSRNRYCAAGPYVANPIPTSVSVQMLCSGFTFTEGPVWSAADSALYFSDFDNGSRTTNYDGDIQRYTAASGCALWQAQTGSNGLALSASGDLLACVHTTQQLSEIDIQSHVVTPLSQDYSGLRYSSPNDLAVRADGSVYFSDPAWNLGTRTKELPQAVYRRDPQGVVSVVEVLEDQRPNGVALSPDETRLYVALLGSVRVYDLDVSGAASNGRLFASLGSDGLAVDCAGNLYVTSGGGQILNPMGEPIGNLNVPGSVTNLAFGGEFGTTLFITGGNQLRSMDLEIPGLPS